MSACYHYLAWALVLGDVLLPLTPSLWPLACQGV